MKIKWYYIIIIGIIMAFIPSGIQFYEIYQKYGLEEAFKIFISVMLPIFWLGLSAIVIFVGMYLKQKQRKK